MKSQKQMYKTKKKRHAGRLEKLAVHVILVFIEGYSDHLVIIRACRSPFLSSAYQDTYSNE